MLVLILNILFSFTPLPPLPPAANLSGSCTWGTVTQTGRNITITGRADWNAVGEIRTDGRIVLYWQQGIRQGIGLYSWDGETLSGHWGWSTDCDLEEDLCGEIMVERFAITRAKD